MTEILSTQKRTEKLFLVLLSIHTFPFSFSFFLFATKLKDVAWMDPVPVSSPNYRKRWLCTYIHPFVQYNTKVSFSNLAPDVDESFVCMGKQATQSNSRKGIAYEL